MKKLILVRHAKSDWSNQLLNDSERPLNDRGKRDAPMMAKRLLDKKIKIDCFVSSPAKRAARTARYFAKAYGVKKDKIDYKDKLYLAEPDGFFSVIERLDDQHETVALFSHNYGITDFANRLTNARIDNIPTCGVFAVAADCQSWKEFATAKKEFLFFDFPKAMQ